MCVFTMWSDAIERSKATGGAEGLCEASLQLLRAQIASEAVFPTTAGARRATGGADPAAGAGRRAPPPALWSARIN